MTLNHRMMAYCAGSFGFTLLNHVFSFYYVKVFLNYFHIPEEWFQFSQLLYLIWNMINDPLFAYIQDTTNFKLTKTRREGILFTAPLFSLSFLITWFQWADGTWVTGVHLMTALCLYDSFFTYIGLAFCCLFTELSTDPDVRFRLVQWSNIASVLASTSVFICEFTSDSLKSFESFHWTTVVISVVAALMMMYAGLHTHTEHDMEQKEKHNDNTHPKTSDSSIWLLTWQILSERNFVSFVIVNFCQMLHRTFYSNFTAIICDELIPDDVVAPSLRKTFYGSLNIFSAIITVVLLPFVQKIGYPTAIKWSFMWKILAGLAMFTLGPQYTYVFMIFILLDSAFAGASMHLFNLPLSDIAYYDMQKYNRRHPITSMVYGTNALITKPAQSIAPMITVAVLNHYGYETLKKGNLTGLSLSSLKNVMFLLVCVYSVLMGVLQIFTWSLYALQPRKPKPTETVVSSCM